MKRRYQAVGETLKVVPASDKHITCGGNCCLKLGRKEEAQREVASAKKLMDADLDKDREKWSDKTISSPELTSGKN